MKYLFALAIDIGDNAPSYTLTGPDENVGEIVTDLFENAEAKQISVRFVTNLEDPDDSTAQAIFEHAEP